MAQPEEFKEPGLGVDYRIGNDTTAASGQWRRNTPPAGEDGTIKSRDGLVTGSNPLAVGDGGVALPLYASTFDLQQM